MKRKKIAFAFYYLNNNVYIRTLKLKKEPSCTHKEFVMEKLPERIRIKDIAKLAGVSVGTVDRVLHGRSGVSDSSRERIEAILKDIDYHPNMYASALASNRRYHFVCMIPAHAEGSYWCDIERGLHQAVEAYADFNISITCLYYDPYNPVSFDECADNLLHLEPDGVVLSPTFPQNTSSLAGHLEELGIPYIFIDSNVTHLHPLAFFGQDSVRSGYFAGSMLMMQAFGESAVVIFRYIRAGQLELMNQQKYREQGFRDYMATCHPKCRILELDIDVSLSDSQVDTLLDNFFALHPEILSGVTFNSQVSVVGKYLQRRSISDFCLLGYDMLERNVECLRLGFVRFLIAQRPILQGYNSIDCLCKSLIFHKEVTQLNYMPIDLLTVDNVDFYNER